MSRPPFIIASTLPHDTPFLTFWALRSFYLYTGFLSEQDIRPLEACMAVSLLWVCSLLQGRGREEWGGGQRGGKRKAYKPRET